ncbi:MAG TPA: PA2169 family four-helix-bundle protein [Cyclobacteriaceae bacterium]
MKKTDTTKVMLNDLIKINTDRVERYKRASYSTVDAELKSIFYIIADESRKNITDITMVMMKYYGAPELNNPMRNGKIFRAWRDVKSKFNGTLHNNLLNSFEFGEMAAIAAYAMAKVDSSHALVQELINRQLEAMKASLEVIKSYRQAYDKVER